MIETFWSFRLDDMNDHAFALLLFGSEMFDYQLFVYLAMVSLILMIIGMKEIHKRRHNFQCLLLRLS